MRVRHRTSWLNVLAVSAGVWTVAIVLQAVASHADTLRRGLSSSLVDSLAVSVLAYLPWIPFSALLFQSLTRRRHRRLSVGGAFTTLAWWWCVYYVPQVAYQVLLARALAERPLPGGFLDQLLQWPLAYWLVDFTLLVATVAVVYGIVITRASAQADTQRLDAIRGQLEPHFLFNALNSISALVRTGNTPRALTALQQLSTLLRFVLSASRRDWVTLEDELSFVREYVAMQTLRFGERLTFTVIGDDMDAQLADCPSLLLQPLVENAIRHGVERHEGSCLITLRAQVVGNDVHIAVSNDVPVDAADNPGLGIGLTTLQERLALLYGDEAMLTTERSADTFQVTVRMPRTRPQS